MNRHQRRAQGITAAEHSDEQVMIAEELGADLVAIVRRRAAKFDRLSGNAVAFALARATSELLASIHSTDEQFEQWCTVTREMLAAQRADAERPPEPTH